MKELSELRITILQSFFSVNELDYEPVAILRREINPAGKSRAFINDTPVTINLLKEMGDRLIDIHSQHQTLMLNNNSFQLNVIDSFAGTGKLLRLNTGTGLDNTEGLKGNMMKPGKKLKRIKPILNITGFSSASSKPPNLPKVSRRILKKSRKCSLMPKR